MFCTAASRSSTTATTRALRRSRPGDARATWAVPDCVETMISPWTFCPVPRLGSQVRETITRSDAVLTDPTATDAAGKKRRKPGQDAARFKTDEGTGKMVIDEENGQEDEPMGEDVAGTAYRETLTSADGFTRGPNGRIKFNKDTKKRRREENDNEDVDMVDAQPSSAKKEKKRHDPKLGHEFKAKVRGYSIRCGNFTDICSICRRRVAIPRRVVWTHTHIFLCRRPRRRRASANASVLLARGNTKLALRSGAHYIVVWLLHILLHTLHSLVNEVILLVHHILCPSLELAWWIVVMEADLRHGKHCLYICSTCSYA